MKKTLALLLAATTAMSVGVTALAQDINVREDVIGTPSIEEVADSSSEGSSSEGSSSEGSSSGGSSSEGSSSSGSSSEGTDKPAADPSGFVFGSDSDNDGAVLGETILEPGTEYKFPASFKAGDETIAITDELMKDHKFSYSRVTSAGVSKFAIEEYKGAYYLYVTVKSSTPLKPVDVKYNVKLVKKSNNMSVFAQEVKFQYGYDESNGDYITGLGKGDIVEIDNARPVITGSQFDKIAKINEYKNVTLSGPSWTFTVNVTDESTKNMVSNNAGVKEVLSKLPDQEFKFFNFAGKPGFNSTGKVSLNVDDIVDDYAKMYTYRYSAGKMYKINATLNEDDNALEFRTNKLDTFVVTDKQIKDGFVVTDQTSGDVAGDNNNDSDSKPEGDKDVPSTGASDMIGAAVAAAMAAVTAGAVVLKKRK